MIWALMVMATAHYHGNSVEFPSTENEAQLLPGTDFFLCEEARRHAIVEDRLLIEIVTVNDVVKPVYDTVYHEQTRGNTSYEGNYDLVANVFTTGYDLNNETFSQT